MSLHDDAERLHRFNNVLHPLLTYRLETEGKLLLNFPCDLAGDTDPSRGCQLLEPRRDVDAFATPVVGIDNHLAEVDPYPDLDPPIFRNNSISFRKSALQRDGTLNSVHDTAEFCKHPVAHQLEDRAMVAGDLGLEQFLASGAKALERPRFVAFHKRRITDNVGRQDGRKLAFQIETLGRSGLLSLYTRFSRSSSFTVQARS